MLRRGLLIIVGAVLSACGDAGPSERELKISLSTIDGISVSDVFKKGETYTIAASCERPYTDGERVKVTVSLEAGEPAQQAQRQLFMACVGKQNERIKREIKELERARIAP